MGYVKIRAPMSVFKRGASWYIDYYEPNGRRVQRSIGPTTQREAKKVWAAQVAAIKERRYIQQNAECDWTVAEMAADWIEYAKLHKRSWADDVSRAKAICQELGAYKIRLLTASDFERYRHSRLRIVANSTVNRDLALLKAMYGRLVRDGKHLSNPLAKVSMLDESHLKRDRILTDAEWNRLLEASGELAPLLIVAYETAMRLGELLGLTWSQVDFEKRLIVLPPEKTKTKRLRRIPFLDQVGAILHTRYRAFNGGYVEGAPHHSRVFTRSGGQIITTISKAWRRACQRAGIQDFRFHDIRHMAITRWVKAGLPEAAIMAMTGHTTRATFDRYANLKPDDLKRYLAAMSSDKSVTVRQRKL